MKQNRTKRAIADAYVKLLGEYIIDKITVKMITDAVGCSRKTFYYYFTDVYDLTEYVLAARMRGFVDENANAQSVRDGFLALVDGLNSDRQMMLNVYHGYGKELLEKFVWQSNYHYAQQFITRYAQTRTIPPEDLEAVVHIFAELLFGMLFDWLNNSMNSDYTRTLDIALGVLPQMLDSLSK